MLANKLKNVLPMVPDIITSEIIEKAKQTINTRGITNIRNYSNVLRYHFRTTIMKIFLKITNKISHTMLLSPFT